MVPITARDFSIKHQVLNRLVYSWLRATFFLWQFHASLRWSGQVVLLHTSSLPDAAYAYSVSLFRHYVVSHAEADRLSSLYKMFHQNT